MIPTIGHPGEGKTIEKVKTSVVATNRDGGEGSEASTEDLQGSENTLDHIIMVGKYHISFPNPQNAHCQDVNYRFEVIVMCW